MQSQGTTTFQVPVKKFPFAHLRKESEGGLIRKPFDLGYHVTVLGKYSKGIPKREPSALDFRKSVSTMPWWTDTRKFNPKY